MIDQARLGKYAGHPELGAADYKLVYHAKNGRAVYSFCMCPGGTVVAATSEPGRVVTNGMSQYSRNERNANAGIVVGINPEQDFPAMRWPAWSCRSVWNRAPTSWAAATTARPGNWWATSFAACRRPSSARSSRPTNRACAGRSGALAAGICHRAIREALPAFGKQIRGFDRADAVLTGIETRTSSPVRITRDSETLQSLNLRGLYPAGEGAGYAGGILSAGVDGIKVAEALAKAMLAEAGQTDVQSH